MPGYFKCPKCDGPMEDRMLIKQYCPKCNKTYPTKELHRVLFVNTDPPRPAPITYQPGLEFVTNVNDAKNIRCSRCKSTNVLWDYDANGKIVRKECNTCGYMEES